ncbi:hypothetical protein [Chitinilyticum aquatile]|uniref:hypothetical protein n=1 Tax=Chitinilyticum aquatile TaxID=362520 RepID=UPI00040F4DBE|nr:hypothetical protein [Chitinilyticum aquatile]
MMIGTRKTLMLSALAASLMLLGTSIESSAAPRAKGEAKAQVNRGGGSGAAAKPNTADHQASRGNVNQANVNKTNTNRQNTNVSNRNVSNTNVNNVNINRDVNVNVDGYHGGSCHGGCYDDDYHPIATAAAVTATVAVTSAVIGSIVNTVPANCVPVNYAGTVYQQCGNTWYQPQYAGSNVTYVVVNPPH